MTTYLVTWEIDIDADTAREAAEKALKIQRNADSRDTVFDVRVLGSFSYKRIDLSCEEVLDNG